MFNGVLPAKAFALAGTLEDEVDGCGRPGPLLVLGFVPQTEDPSVAFAVGERPGGDSTSFAGGAALPFFSDMASRTSATG